MIMLEFKWSISAAVKELLKVWIYEVTKHYGSHFEKMALARFCVTVRIFLCAWGLELVIFPEENFLCGKFKLLFDLIH